MLQRLEMQGVDLPRLYIAQDKTDVDVARKNGLPYVSWRGSQRDLIVLLLWPTLKNMFPGIDWDKVFGNRLRKLRSHVTVDKSEANVASSGKKTTSPDASPDDALHIADDGTIDVDVSVNAKIHGGYIDNPCIGSDTTNISIEEYAGDLSSCINIEVLQKLRLMPAFIGDIMDCVRLNLTSGIHWREGYNKKRGLPVGRYDAARQLPNLIILDVSFSIPRGISATMLTLVDTLRSQVTADLIVTGEHSKFYPMGSELPSPQELRKEVPLGQEGKEFIEILREHVQGRHYGHVFSFGDGDCPLHYGGGDRYPVIGTRVDAVHHYHTVYNYDTGYAMWCNELSEKPKIIEHDHTWCKVIYTNY